MSAGLIIGLVFLAGLVLFIWKGLFIVQQSEAVVVERLGSYRRTLDPGINFLIPIIDQARPIKMRRYDTVGLGKELRQRIVEEKKIDVRETVLNFPSQPVVTKDNVSVNIDGALYFQIHSPKDAVYQVENLIQAIETLAKTTLRSVVGEKELDQMFSSRDEINARLQQVMDEAGDKWGVKVNRVEIQDIEIPKSVEESMHKQMTAERERRAMVAQAKGIREAEIAKADGDRQAAILRAEGEQHAINKVLSAGKANKIDMDPNVVVSYLIAQRYMEVLPKIAQDGERVLVPYEATALLGSIEGIQDLFGKAVGGAAPASKPNPFIKS